MQKKPGCWIPIVGVEGLGSGDEANAVGVERLQAVQAVSKGAPEAVQFPAKDDIEFPCRASAISQFQHWPAGFRAADGVLGKFL